MKGNLDLETAEQLSKELNLRMLVFLFGVQQQYFPWKSLPLDKLAPGKELRATIFYLDLQVPTGKTNGEQERRIKVEDHLVNSTQQ